VVKEAKVLRAPWGKGKSKRKQEWRSVYCADVAEEIIIIIIMTITHMLLSIYKACEHISDERIKLIMREVAAVNSGISEPFTSKDVSRV
jgi:hypothetical protein